MKKAKNQRADHSFKQGERLLAVIEERTKDSVKLRVDDRRFFFEMPPGEVKGEAGDTVAFEVVSQTKDNLTLRQIANNEDFSKQLQKQNKLDYTFDIMEKNDFGERPVAPLDISEQTEKIEEEKAMQAKALAQAKRDISASANRAGQAAVRALAAQGVDITKVEVGALAGMITEISKEIAVDPSKNSAGAELLNEAGLAPTRRNMDVLADIETRINGISNMSGNAAAEFIASGKEASISNISQYAAAGDRQDPSDQNELPEKEIKEEIKKLFELEGIENNKENLDAAKVLIKRGAAVTKENLSLFASLTQMSENDSRGLLIQALVNYKAGEPALSARLGEWQKPLDKAEFEKLNYKISIISAEHVELAILQNRPVTITSLAELAAAGQGSETTTDQGLAYMKDLAEIRLRFTYEAANRLYQKNVPIDVLSLSQAVGALKSAENEGYKAYLRAVDAPNEEPSKLAEVMAAVKDIRRIPDTGYGDIITARIQFTMRAVAAAAPPLTGSEVARSYAAFEASPARKYGDSIKDAAREYSRILQENGIAVTNQNIKAARILSANGMDLTWDNIVAVKAADAKLTDISSKLHPMIAAKMIKERMNPLDMNIDDVLDYIKTFGDEYGESSLDALAEHIHSMEKSGKLDDKTRQAMIDIYKMLHIIQNNGQGLGAAIKANAPLTLGRLLEMTEARKTKVNILTGDNRKTYRTAGKAIKENLREMSRDKDNPDNQIDRDYWSYGTRLAEGFNMAANPDALSSVLNQKDLLGTELETAMEDMAEFNEQNNEHLNDKTAEKAETVRSLEDAPPNIIKTMVYSGIPLTAVNIKSFKKPSEEIDNIKNAKVKEKIEKSIDGADLKNVSEKGFEGYIDEISDAIQEAADLGIGDSERVDAAIRAIRLHYMAAGSSGGHYVPVKLNGKITDVNMYITGDNLAGKERVTIALMIEARQSLINMRIDVGDGVSVKADSDGINIDRDGKLSKALKAVYGGQRPENLEHEAIRTGTLPEGLRAIASAALRYIEDLA